MGALGGRNVVDVFGEGSEEGNMAEPVALRGEIGGRSGLL